MVKYFNLGGKDRPVFFGMAALVAYETAANRPVSSLILEMAAGEVKLGDMIVMVASGLEHGASKTGKPEKFDLLEVYDWIDEAPEMLPAIMEHFADSQIRASAKKNITPPETI